MARLVVISGPNSGDVFPVVDGAPLLIGRARNAAIRLRDLRVSRVHCQVRCANGRATVLDLEGHGGTRVNGKRIDTHDLSPGDTIQVGKTLLRYDTEVSRTTRTDSATITSAPVPVLPAESLHELTGHSLAEFQVGAVLATAQSGLVFRARNTRTGQDVALKVLWPEFSLDKDAVKRFVRSVKTMLPLRHPHLVRVRRAGKSGPYCWLSMEYVDGESLSQVIQRCGKDGMLDWRYALRVGIHISRALVYLHDRHIVHRNITPHNILIRTGDYLAKLGDWMTAKALAGSLANDLKQEGDVLGAIHFMAPERIGSTTAEPRSDLYSLGATMYVILTGRTPFQADTITDLARQIRASAVPPPRRSSPASPHRSKRSSSAACPGARRNAIPAPANCWAR